MPDEVEDYELDDQAWDEAEQSWAIEVEVLAAAVGQPEEWVSYFPKYFGDGITPIPRSDRPICERRSVRLDRSFVIYQYRRFDASTAGIAAEVKDHTKVFVDDDASDWFEKTPPHDRIPRASLVLQLEYSDATVTLARTLLTQWMKDDTTVGTFRELLDGNPAVDHW